MQEIENTANKLTVHGKDVEQLKVEHSVRTLGVWMSPYLMWNDQFEVMRKKMYESARKLMNAEIKTWQVHIYFHIYVIKSVFFGCGVVNLSDEQHKELEKIHEVSILRELNLSEKSQITHN